MLAGTYQNKAIALRVVGDLAGAVGLFDRGLEIFERLVEEGRRELADPLAMSYMNKAGALQALGDLAGAVGFFDRALAIYERLFEQEGRSDAGGRLGHDLPEQGERVTGARGPRGGGRMLRPDACDLRAPSRAGEAVGSGGRVGRDLPEQGERVG